jgi:hypothetical protein
MRRLVPILLLFALVGCGAQEDERVDAAQVAAKTGGAATARVEMEIELEVADKTPPPDVAKEIAAASFAATGSIAEHGKLFEFHYTMAASQLGIEQPGDVEFDAIIDGETGDAYFDYPDALDLALPPGKRWVHLRDAELAGLQKSSDPASMVAYLYAAGDLEEVGEERVRGVETTRYEATLDIERAIEAQDLPEKARKSLEDSVELLRGAGLNEIPMDVWIDGDGYVRRMNLDMSLDEFTGSPEGARVKMHIELWDFGADMGVERPAASTVVELEDLEG